MAKLQLNIFAKKKVIHIRDLVYYTVPPLSAHDYMISPTQGDKSQDKIDIDVLLSCVSTCIDYVLSVHTFTDIVSGL